MYVIRTMSYIVYLLHILLCKRSIVSYSKEGPSWSWIYNYLCNQCLCPLMLSVRIPLRRDVLNTILCDKVCQWLATDLWFSLCTPVSSTNKTVCHNITEILLKVALNIITITITYSKDSTVKLVFNGHLWDKGKWPGKTSDHLFKIDWRGLPVPGS